MKGGNSRFLSLLLSFSTSAIDFFHCLASQTRKSADAFVTRYVAVNNPYMDSYSSCSTRGKHAVE